LKKSLLLLLFILLSNASSLEESQSRVTQSNTYSKETQAKIDTLDDTSKELFSEYKSVMAQLETQKRYNKSLNEVIESQLGEKAIFERDIEKIEHTHKNIYPLMQNMIASLEKFISIDTPFLIEERTKRVQKLKDNMKRADITVSDKYRQVLEAYKIEYDYARTIEAYKGDLNGKVVQFLRIGRVGLFYQTLDFKDSGVYDTKEKKFVELDSSYNSQILNAIKIASKQLAPDLLILPLRGGES
jgi:hypothetical protein